MKIKFKLEYEAEVELEAYPKGVDSVEGIIAHELDNFDHKFLMQVLANDDYNVEITEIKESEIF